MKYYYIEPEVAGGLGERTIMDATIHPPKITKLHYQLDGWMGDVLLETFPCYIITETAMKEIELSDATGVGFDRVEVTLSDNFREMYPDRNIPLFYWIQVNGICGLDDFGITQDFRLVISEKMLLLLQQLGISHSEIEGFKSLDV